MQLSTVNYQLSITKGHLYQKRKENSFMKRIIFLFFILHASFFTAFAVGASGIYQYSVALTGYVSTETGKAPTAYLWIPEGCQQVKAVMLAQQNMTEEMLYKNETFRERMKALDLALVWVAPWFSQNWDPTTGCQQTFEEMMVGLAGQSGHRELERVPIIPFGHSAQATFPWNFAAWNNERTLCIISFHGDAGSGHFEMMSETAEYIAKFTREIPYLTPSSRWFIEESERTRRLVGLPLQPRPAAYRWRWRQG